MEIIGNSELLDFLYILDCGHYRPLSQVRTMVQWNHVIPLVKANECHKVLDLIQYLNQINK
jgi:hypothetical protein